MPNEDFCPVSFFVSVSVVAVMPSVIETMTADSQYLVVVVMGGGGDVFVWCVSVCVRVCV